MKKWSLSKWIGFGMLSSLVAAIIAASVVQNGLATTLVSVGILLFIFVAVALFFE